MGLTPVSSKPSAPRSLVYTAECSCHPDAGVRYVGQTIKGLRSREHVHLWNSRTPESKSYRSYLSNWIRKHGEENIVFRVHEVCDPERLDDRESYWISEFRLRGQKLTNIKTGGSSSRGYKVPLMSERMSGPRNPMYGKDRREVMAHARSFMKPMSEERRKAVSVRSAGEGNPKAKLTEEDVVSIRMVESYHGVNADLARQYGVTPAMISAIRLRRNWKHVE